MQTDFIYDCIPHYVQPRVLNASRYTGKERDGESGNDYFGARYYASSMGRFMSPDPIFGEAERVLDPQQWNMYAYVRNNPLSITDSTGMDFNLTCSQNNGTTCVGGLQGQTTTDANGKSTFTATYIDMNKQGDPSAGYSDQWGNEYKGTFDQDNGVSFTSADGTTSSHSQFIDGSDPTQLTGAQGSAFGGMKANFFDACGPSSSCQGRFTLYGTKDQFNTMESTLHKSGGFKSFMDGFSGAHPFISDQWKGGGPNNNYVHMISVPGYHMDGHFEGSTTAGLHAFSTIKDLATGAAAGERGKLVPGKDY
jgi:RHS repeat-associated protein